MEVIDEKILSNFYLFFEQNLPKNKNNQMSYFFLSHILL